MVAVSVIDVLVNDDGTVVVLQEQGAKRRIIPIAIGEIEGQAIAMRLTRQKYVRPLTHDLFETVIENFEIELIRVEIDDLKETIFLAHLFFIDGTGRSKKIDARPSDGITLALGQDAPIYMSSNVIDEIGEMISAEPAADAGPENGADSVPTSVEAPPREI
jgi:bifunctional DNase/RNase